MIYTLNTQTPSFKQDEYNAHQIKINVPDQMQGFNLFVVFALPSGRKVFTPRLDLTSGAVTYPLSKGITSEIGRVNVELQGYYNDKYIKSITYSFNVVASLTTDDDPDQSDFVPWYLEVMQKADQVDKVGADLEARLVALKIAEPQREMNELIRIHNENERIDNEIQREANEVIRQGVYESKADKINTYTKTEVDNKNELFVPKTTTVNTKALSGNISVTAADVPNTPAGNIAATNVQAALNELDTEKVPKTTTVNTKALSGNISVTAADVPNTPAGTIAATTVQAALNELDTEKVPKTTTVNTKALSGNISVTAADVPNTPAGNIAATNVQAALNELDTEKVPKTTTVNTKALSGNISVTAADVPNTPAGNIAATNVQAALNELDTEKAQTGLPCVIARNSVAQSTTFNTSTILNFDTNVYINDATMRDTDQTKVTIRKAGIYLINAQLELTANAIGMRTFNIKKNDTIDLVRETHPSEIAGAASRMQIQTVALLAVADYITVGIYHNAGVNLNTITGDHSPVLSICMLEAI